MAREELVVTAHELKVGDFIRAFGVFSSSLPGGHEIKRIERKLIDDSTTIYIGYDSQLTVNGSWNIAISREKEMLAQYYFKSHPMKEEKLVSKNSLLWRNASIIVHDGKVLKHPE